MKTKNYMIKRGSKVDFELLRESMKVSRRLAKLGFGSGKSYDLPAPYQNRLIKTTPAELLALQED
jgi:hypothetical protein